MFETTNQIYTVIVCPWFTTYMNINRNTYYSEYVYIYIYMYIYIYKYFNILTRFLKQIMAVTRTSTVTPTAVVRCRRAAIHRSALPRKPWVRLGAVARGEGHLTQFQETLLRLHANDPSVFQGNKEGKGQWRRAFMIDLYLCLSLDKCIYIYIIDYDVNNSWSCNKSERNQPELLEC